MATGYKNVDYWLEHVMAHYVACIAAGHPYPKTEEEKLFREHYESQAREAKAQVVEEVTGVGAPACEDCPQRANCTNGYYVWGGSKARCTKLEAYNKALDSVFNRPSPPKESK
jgi:hypothetical protein